MRCPIETHESAEWLLAWCDRRLDAGAAAAFERHLAICPACRQMADEQLAIWNALDAWEAAPVSPDFDRRLYARIEREVSWCDRIIRPFRPLLVRQGLSAAAAACLVLMAGLLMEQPEQRAVSPVPPAPVEAVQADQVDHQLEDMELLREFHRTLRGDGAQSNL